MVDSLFLSIGTSDIASPESGLKKPRLSETQRFEEESFERWKKNRIQQIYAYKLIQALHRVRQRSSTTREIRETSDRVLAVSARGSTRWSRAILTNRVRSKLKKVKKSTRNCKLRNSETKRNRIKLPAVGKKLKILSRLVPGCRKISVPNLLDETTDYIAALEMQIRAMEALAELLTTAAAPGTRFTGDLNGDS